MLNKIFNKYHARIPITDLIMKSVNLRLYCIILFKKQEMWYCNNTFVQRMIAIIYI